MAKNLQETVSKLRRRLTLETQVAYLGDGTGEVHDRNNPGLYLVRFPQADGGFSHPIPIPAIPNANLPTTDGLPVDVGYDQNDKLIIISVNLTKLSATDNNQLQFNPLDQQASEFLSQTKFSTLYATRHADVDNFPFYAVVFPGVFFASDVLTLFEGESVDLSSFQPSSGEHCYVIVCLKTDATLEAFASTPIDSGDPLSFDDVEEAYGSASAGSIPLKAWQLDGDDTALTVDENLMVDLRVIVDSPVTGGGASPATTVTDETTYGISPAVGTDVSYAREDHTHGSPADPAGTFVAKSLFDANTILKADTDNTPVALTMGASTILARLAAGNIVAATVAEIKTLLALAVADISGAANTALSNLASVAINTSLVSDTDNTDSLGSASIKWLAAFANLFVGEERSAPSTPASGDVNLYFDTLGNPHVIDDLGQNVYLGKDNPTARVGFASSTAENTIASWTIEEDEYGSTARAMIEVDGTIFNGKGSDGTATLKLKVGSFTLTLMNAQNITNNAARRNAFSIRAVLYGIGSVSTQRLITIFSYLNNVVADTAGTPIVTMYHSTPAQDFSAGDVAISATLQLNASDANFSDEGSGNLRGPWSF